MVSGCSVLGQFRAESRALCASHCPAGKCHVGMWRARCREGVGGGRSRGGRNTALHHICQMKPLSSSQLPGPYISQIEATSSQVCTPAAGRPGVKGGTVGSALCAQNLRSREGSGSVYRCPLSSSLRSCSTVPALRVPYCIC